ncbi:MAG: EF-hand domain-containing protein [Phycisphaerales bacterium]
MRFAAAVAVVGLCLACCDAKAVAGGGGGGGVQGDDCTVPIAISGLGTFGYTQTGATNSFPVGASCGGNNDIWFLWTCPADGNYVFDTCAGAPFDSLLGVFFSGCGLSIIACNDDGCNLNSRLETPQLTGGESYLVQISSFFPEEFTPFGVLTISDGVSTPPTGFGQSVPFVGSNDGLGRVAFEVFVQPGTNPFDLALQVSVNTSSLGGGVIQLADDGVVPDYFESDLVFSGDYSIPLGVTPGQYTVSFTVMDGQGRSSGGTFDVLITDEPTPLNDECETATPISGTGAFEYSVGLATTSPQNMPCDQMRSDIWFRWTCTESGGYIFSTCDGYNSLDTVMEVHAGECNALEVLGCDDNSCGGGKGSAGQAEVVLGDLVAGTVYTVRIGVAPFAFVQDGVFDLTIMPVSPSPPTGFSNTDPVPVLSDGASAVTITVFVTPGENPLSTGLSVTLDGSAFGLGMLTLLDDGVAPDQAADDLVFTTAFVVSSTVPAGFYFPEFAVSDAEMRSTTNLAFVQVVEPRGACCEGSSCQVRTANACASVGGVFLGHQAPCSPGEGYTIAPGGSPFENISTTGTRLSAIDGFDDFSTSVLLPFAFPFYQSLESTLFVSTNGFVTFEGAGTTTFSNTPIPTTEAPNAALYCLWDDWVNDNGIFVETRGTIGVDRRFIVQWNNIRQFGSGGPRGTFQLALFETGRVEYRYATIGADSFGDYTVGAESTNGLSGSQYPSHLLGSGNTSLELTFVPGTSACDANPCPVDFNNDGFVEPGDLDEFITAFFSDIPEENARCDFNNDGFVEPGDLDEFITAFFEGGC